MRTININIYQYDELSEAAKKKAYETWQKEQQYTGYDCWELRPLLEKLEDYDLELKTWEYDGCGHTFNVKNNSFDNSTRYEYDIQWSELSGKTALKKAMRLYDELTKCPVYYSKPNGKTTYKPNGGQTIVKSRCQSSNDSLIDETWLGSAFAYGLSAAIKRKQLTWSYYDYINAAFTSLFEAVCDDYHYYYSEENFINNHTHDNEYLESGEIYNV